MQRTALGAISLVLIVGGAIGAFAGLLDDSEWWGGVSLRAGLILGVLWLVMPKARDVPPPVWAGVGMFAAVLAIRPRLVLLGIGLSFFAMLGVAVFQRRTAR